MVNNLVKKVFFLCLISLLSFNPAWVQAVLAQEATPSAQVLVDTPQASASASLAATYEPVATPSAQPAESTPVWQLSADNSYTTTSEVVLGSVYQAPQNGKVTITFSKLPNPSGKLTIKEVKLSPEQIKATNALSDIAYDITSTMANGTFEYTLTLPTPRVNQVEVKASEDGQTFVTLGGVSAQQDTLTISGLNHFTLFVVTTVADFTAGVSTNTTVTDVAGGDGSVTNTLGAETQDQSQPTGITAQNFNNTNWLAQTFTAGTTGLLTKVRLSLRRAANTDGNVTVEIRNTVSGAPGTPPALATTSRPATDLTTAQADYDFSFASPPALTSGTVYAIVVYRSGAGVLTANYTWFRGIAGAGADQYPNGGRFTSNDSGATWILQTTANPGTGDLRFTTFARSFATSGTQTSDVLDTSSTATKFSQISWTETLPVGTDITFGVRASISTFAKTDAIPSWVSLGTANSPISLTSFLPDTYRYFQWRATLSGTGSVTPTLLDVTLIYNHPPNTPALATPANAAVTSDNTPDLSWTVATPLDPDSADTVSYDIQVDNNADFSSPEYSATGITGTTRTTSALTDGTYNWRVRAVDNSNYAGSWTAARSLTIDITAPSGSWSSPASGATVTGTPGLIVSASDATSGVASVTFSYRLGSSSGSFTAIDTDTTFPYTAAWDTSGLALDTYTLRATILDNAGNISTVDRNVDVGAVVSNQVSSTASFTSINVSWNTNRPTTGRVIYDTVSHPTLGDAPNYGYALTTGEFDTNPKTTSHNIVIGGLSSGTLYYYRTISTGSPVTISEEKGVQTFSIPGAGPPPSPGGAAPVTSVISTTGQVLGTTATLATSISPTVIFPPVTEVEAVPKEELPQPEGEVKGVQAQPQSNLFSLILNFFKTILNFLLNLFRF